MDNTVTENSCPLDILNKSTATDAARLAELKTAIEIRTGKKVLMVWRSGDDYKFRI